MNDLNIVMEIAVDAEALAVEYRPLIRRAAVARTGRARIIWRVRERPAFGGGEYTVYAIAGPDRVSIAQQYRQARLDLVPRRTAEHDALQCCKPQENA